MVEERGFVVEPVNGVGNAADAEDGAGRPGAGPPKPWTPPEKSGPVIGAVSDIIDEKCEGSDGVRPSNACHDVIGAGALMGESGKKGDSQM